MENLSTEKILLCIRIEGLTVWTGWEKNKNKKQNLTYFDYNSIKMQMEIRKTYKKMSKTSFRLNLLSIRK